MQTTKTTLQEIIEYHLRVARSTHDYGEVIRHRDYATALKAYLPPLPCGSCRGYGFQQLQDSDAFELVPCECAQA